MLFFLLVLGYPLLLAGWMSLHEISNLTAQSAFVGLRNYIEYLGSLEFRESLWTTLIYMFFSLVGSYLVGLITALILNRRFVGRGIVRSMFILPWAVPHVIAVSVWIWILDANFGIANYLLLQLGFIDEPLQWLLQPGLAMTSVILVTIWKYFPFATVMLLAALQSVDTDLYEAAIIDGANRFQLFRYITLPSIAPVTQMLILILTIWSFKRFSIIYVMTQGGPARATETLVVQVYNQAFKYFQFGYGSAIGMTMFLITIIFSAVYLYVMSKRQP
jgi:multiple sugar transport system permease protein